MSPDLQHELEKLLTRFKDNLRRAQNAEAVAINGLINAKENRKKAEQTVKDLETLLK